MQIGMGLAMRMPQGRTIIQRAIALLRRFGTDAHLWLPGIGSINGLTVWNYLDSAGTTLATVDNPVGLVKDALNLVGGIDAIQSTTANKPIERLTAGKYGLQYDGSGDSMVLSNVPFQMSDDHVVIVGANCTTNASYPFICKLGYDPIAAGAVVNMFIDVGGFVSTLWKNDAGTTTYAGTGPGYQNGVPFVASARKTGSDVVSRFNGVPGAVGTAPTGTATVSIGTIGSTNFPGTLYPTIAIKGTVTDAELLLLERFVGALSGVTI